MWSRGRGHKRAAGAGDPVAAECHRASLVHPVSLPLELELPGHGTAWKNLGVVLLHRQISRNDKYNKYVESILKQFKLEDI